MAALPGEELWRFQPSVTSGYEIAYGVAADADGDFFIGGCTSGNLNAFVVNAGENDFAVAKVSGVNGSVLWSWQDGTAGDECLSSAAATDDGGVVVGGHTNGTYNGVASEGLVDFAAIKLDADGTVEWIWQEGTVEDDFMNSCSKTADGNVVLSGATPGNWAGTGSGDANIVAVKLDVTDGTVIWRYQESVSINSVVSFAATARADGSVVLAGWTNGDWFGEVAGQADFAAVALDEDGVELWRWQGGQALGSNAAWGVTSLPDGSVVLAGETDGDFAAANSHAGGKDFAIVKLTADGETEWTWQDGTENDDTFVGAVAGIDGSSLVFAGWTKGSWVETQAGTDDYTDFAGLSLDADGTLLWTYQAGTTSHNEFRDVAVRPTDGAAFLVGWTHEDFVDGTINSLSDAAGVLIETGAEAFTPAPAPAAATQPTAPVSGSSSCGATEAFLVVSADLPAVEGCYQATEQSFADEGDTAAVWTVSGTLDGGQVVVIGTADDGTGGVADSGWSMFYFADGDDEESIFYCISVEDSATVHPADAAWTCDFEGTGSFVAVTDASFSLDCGCSAAPTAAPDDVQPPETAPVAESEAETRSVEDSGDGSSSVPLGPVIGGSVAGVALLAIVGVFAVKRSRAKKNDKSFGASPTDNPTVWRRDGGSGGAGAGAGAGAAGAPAVDKHGAASPPPPPAYSEPPPPHADAAHPADDLPPPPAYSEPPPYSG